MDYRALIRRLRGGMRRYTGRPCVMLRIRADEAESLLQSLTALRKTAETARLSEPQLRREIETLHEALAELHLKNRELTLQLRSARHQQSLLPESPHALAALDPWQRRMLEEGEQRRVMRGRV